MFWSPGNSSFDSLVVNPANTTTFTVSVTDQCSQTLSQPITVVTNFIQAGFHFNFTTNQNIQFNNVSAGAASYLWNFGDSSADSSSHAQNPVHYYASDGTYVVSLVVTNTQGCKDSVFQTLVILPDFYFYFPNSFSPNDDGKNDIFTGYGIGIKSYRMTIYNRWGELIYISTDITKGWDGIYMSGEAPAGEYVCMFDLETFNNKEIRKIGNLNLIR
jgi:gliding motility-associated-like protein